MNNNAVSCIFSSVAGFDAHIAPRKSDKIAFGAGILLPSLQSSVTAKYKYQSTTVFFSVLAFKLRLSSQSKSFFRYFSQILKTCLFYMYFVIMNVCTAFRLISELQSIGNKQIFHLLLRQIGFVRKHHKAKLTVFFCVN